MRDSYKWNLSSYSLKTFVMSQLVENYDAQYWHPDNQGMLFVRVSGLFSHTSPERWRAQTCTAKTGRILFASLTKVRPIGQALPSTVLRLRKHARGSRDAEALSKAGSSHWGQDNRRTTLSFSTCRVLLSTVPYEGSLGILKRTLEETKTEL